MHEISVASRRGLPTGRRAGVRFLGAAWKLCLRECWRLAHEQLDQSVIKNLCAVSVLDVSSAQGSSNGADSESALVLRLFACDCWHRSLKIFGIHLPFVISSHFHSCTHTHTHAHTQIYIDIHACFSLHAPTRPARTHAHTHARTHSCNCVCAWENIPAQICAHMHGHIAAVCSFSLIISNSAHTHAPY